jgi:hypothetical protein
MDRAVSAAGHHQVTSFFLTAEGDFLGFLGMVGQGDVPRKAQELRLGF